MSNNKNSLEDAIEKAKGTRLESVAEYIGKLAEAKPVIEEECKRQNRPFLMNGYTASLDELSFAFASLVFKK